MSRIKCYLFCLDMGLEERPTLPFRMVGGKVAPDKFQIMFILDLRFKRLRVKYA